MKLDETLPARFSHTSQLEVAELDALRSFLNFAFNDGFDDHDWDHALGGMHVIGHEGDVIVAHASVVQRRLLHGDLALRTGYVEAVAVHPSYRRRGYGKRVMSAVDKIIRSGYEVGALSAGPDAGRVYESVGWRRWRGATWTLTPDGMKRTPDDDDSTYVLEFSAPLDLDGDLVCDWRDGDVW